MQEEKFQPVVEELKENIEPPPEETEVEDNIETSAEVVAEVEQNVDDTPVDINLEDPETQKAAKAIQAAFRAKFGAKKEKTADPIPEKVKSCKLHMSNYIIDSKTKQAQYFST